jgi:uncharacterized membrane protein YGL010W
MTELQIESQERNAMSLGELVAWAWRETPPVHRSTGNLLIHIVAVPMFVVGHVLLIAAIAAANLWLLVAGISLIVVSVALQRLGHSMESQAVHPFEGSRDLIRRLYVEQFYNFWRFLFTGGWFASLRASLNKR